MTAAQNALEEVLSSLGSAHDATDGAVNASGEITTKLSPNDIAERCGGVAGQLDAATSAVESADGSGHEALNYSQQAEADSLTGMIGSVFDDLGTARQSIEAAKTVTEAEQQEAAAWAKTDPGRRWLSVAAARHTPRPCPGFPPRRGASRAAPHRQQDNRHRHAARRH